MSSNIQKALEYYSDILDAYEQIDSLNNLNLETNQSITEEINDQNTALNKQLDIVSQISDIMTAGGIDTENYYQSRAIIGQLSAAGLSGSDLLSAANSLNLTGGGNNSNIGAINIEVNEASGQTLEQSVNGQLAAIFGR